MRDFRAKAKEYLCKHQLYPSQISTPPSARLGLLVTIPSREEPNVLRTLCSLAACDPPACDVEIVVCVNGPDGDEQARERNSATLEQVRAYAESRHSSFPVHVLDFTRLPPELAGVGLARKLAMDAAVTRLHRAGASDRTLTMPAAELERRAAVGDLTANDGVIACLDADCVCAPNYLTALATHFARHPRTPACAIYFEHPLVGDADLRRSAVRYELFLRYYRRGLMAAGHPHAFHTVGSSMAVRASAYVAQGGMNRRSGAEDFYFLSKLFGLGDFSELNATTVRPAARISDRVPFGTGRAIGRLTGAPQATYRVHPCMPFYELRVLFDSVAALKHRGLSEVALPDNVVRFMSIQDGERRLAEIHRHSASDDAFAKRFFLWFDLFKVRQYVRFASDASYPPVAVATAARELLEREDSDFTCEPRSELALLERYRWLDRHRPAWPQRVTAH